MVLDLVVQALRRVYWPKDQDLMQRIEKDTYARAKKQRKEAGVPSLDNKGSILVEPIDEENRIRREDVVFNSATDDSPTK